jgi:hypothetical protein
MCFLLGVFAAAVPTYAEGHAPVCHPAGVPETPRRKTLTPLESELRPEEPQRPSRPPGPVTRLRRRRQRERRPPATLAGAVRRGLGRLAIVIAVASAVALVVARYADRRASFGLYAVGAFVLLAAVLMSSAGTGTRFYFSASERERRVRLSLSYVLAGALVVAIAVLMDTLGR